MNPADYLLIAIVVISAVVGIMRGLLREVIAILTWVLALWLGWQLAPALEPHLGGLLEGPQVRPWAARAIIVIAVLLLGAATGAIVGYFVRLSIFSAADRFFGFLFGLARGVILVGVFAIVGQLVLLDGEPWWRTSRLMPFAEDVADVLRGMVGEPARAISAARQSAGAE